MPREIQAKTILNKKKKRDDWFLDDYTVNLYSGCSFNCLYCYIRGSKYGENLAESISVKINALELLDKELGNRARKEQYGVIVLSSATDPYVSIDQKYKLMRGALEIIEKHRFPVHIITKSDGVVRDFDILDKINANAILPGDLAGKLPGGVIVTFSFSTLDDRVGKIFEPGVAPPHQRLRALQRVNQHGFLAGVSLMPLLPFISDTGEQLHDYFKTFRKYGAAYIMPATLTLFGNGKSDSKTLVLNAIKQHYPELIERYLSYFDKENEVPKYYQKAFYEKVKELSEIYQVPNRIL